MKIEITASAEELRKLMSEEEEKEVVPEDVAITLLRKAVKRNDHKSAMF